MSVRIIADSVADCKPFFGIIFPAFALLLQFVIADNPPDFRQHGFRNGAHGVAQMMKDGGRVKIPDSVEVVGVDIVRGIQAATRQNRILDADGHNAPETRPDGLVALTLQTAPVGVVKGVREVVGVDLIGGAAGNLH